MRRRKATYGELIGGKRFNMNLQPTAKRKPQKDWTVLGTSVPRVDMPDLVTGRFEFAHNVRVPGMVHGRVVRPPAIGATLVSVDESSVSGLPGNVKVVVKKNWVGVVADKPWQAIQAAEKLKVTWTPGTGLPSQREFYSYMRNHPGKRDAYSVNSKDVDAKLAGRRRGSRRRTSIRTRCTDRSAAPAPLRTSRAKTRRSGRPRRRSIRCGAPARWSSACSRRTSA